MISNLLIFYSCIILQIYYLSNASECIIVWCNFFLTMHYITLYTGVEFNSLIFDVLNDQPTSCRLSTNAAMSALVVNIQNRQHFDVTEVEGLCHVGNLIELYIFWENIL